MRSANSVPCVEVSGLRKTYVPVVALDGIDLAVEEGHISGLVGPNGAGKSTALHALLGLVAYEGSVRVLGKNPRSERHRLMRDVSFIADVAVLRVGSAWGSCSTTSPACIHASTAPRILAAAGSGTPISPKLPRHGDAAPPRGGQRTSTRGAQLDEPTPVSAARSQQF
jgi:energy-coupling factor transporter ATP-binding protein EcfA2